MIYRGFCAGSNPSQSLIADCERTMNWYPERIDSPTAPTEMALYPTPGFQPFLTVGDLSARACFQMNGRAFAVIGPTFYELLETGSVINRGTVAEDNNLATICSNGVGNQLGITSGGNWYTYALDTNTLTPVAALAGKATQGGMKDGFFLCFDANSGTVFVSNENDGLTWNTVTQFFERSIAPDKWVAMVVGNPQIYLLGEQTSEAWYNAGNSPQPFAPILSSFMQYGTPSTFASAMMGDTLAFLSRDKNGQGIVIAARGYDPLPVSNYAVETAIQGYARQFSISNAELLVYQDQGHLFGNFSFPSSGGTWTVDLNGGGLWHERGTWQSTTNAFDIWTPRVHMYAFGKHLVGDRATGTIAEMDVTLGTEADGSVIRRRRVGPPIWANDTQRMQISRLALQFEPGLGTTSGPGSDPQCMLRTSADAKTWSTERRASVGKIGQYRKRVYFTRLGSNTKLFVPELSVSDPIPWRLSGAELEGTGFAQSPQAAA